MKISHKTGIILCFFLSIYFPFSGCAGKEKFRSQEDEKTLLQAKADTAMIYCVENKMNADICFLIDMSIHSGKYRFYAWSFTEGKVLFSGLCCHGMGGNSTVETPEFSNISGSNCTSLGKYKLGIRSYSQWGINIHYKMHGLESTNNNAYSRYVVLHSFSSVSDNEIYPQHLPLGWSLGCPVISDNTMRKVDELLKDLKSEKPVLLWIYIS